MTQHKTTTTSQPERPVWERNVIDRVMDDVKELMLQRATVRGWQSTDFESPEELANYTETRHYVYIIYKSEVIKGIVTGFHSEEFTNDTLFKFIVTKYDEQTKRFQTYQVRPQDIYDTYEQADEKARSKR